MRRILVTGGAGFIGSSLVQKLLDIGDEVTIIDDLISMNDGDSVKAKYSIGTAFFKEDIRNATKVNDIVKRQKPSVCIHLAAKLNVAGPADNLHEMMSVNIDGTRTMLTACEKNGVETFVFASSAAVYGEARNLPLRENDVLNPVSHYGVSKVAGESLVESCGISGKIKNAISLRFFNVFGNGQNSEYAGVITKFSDQLAKGYPPIIFGDGKQTRDFIYVEDVVHALIAAIKSHRPGTYNIATGKSISINQLAEMMSKIIGSKKNPVYLPRRMGDIIFSEADVEKAKAELHFSSQHTLNQYLQLTLRRMTVKGNE